MRHVALIYNPTSGQGSPRRRTAIDQVAAVLRGAGIEAETLETLGPGSAGSLAEEAMRRGCDTIIACGGDGTVHEVLQSLIGTDVILGVVPFGTANALAANLGLGSSPVKAIRKLLDAHPVRISVGRISYRKGTGETLERYFTVAAGVGADALFLSRLDAGIKRRFGYLLYLVEAFRVWATYSFPLFEAAFEESATSSPRVSKSRSSLRFGFATLAGSCKSLPPAPLCAAMGSASSLSRRGAVCNTAGFCSRLYSAAKPSTGKLSCSMPSQWSAVPAAAPLCGPSLKPTVSSSAIFPSESKSSRRH